MNILRLIGQLLLIYFLYKLIFDFIIPIYQTSKRVKSQMREMNARMQQQTNRDNYSANQQQNTSAKPPKQETVSKEDYIDYEEIK